MFLRDLVLGIYTMSIENVDLFDGLMPEEIQILRETSVVREFAKNTVLIHEGDV
ncbi:MAG: CRP/FNR family cyclic AMP-dependent transcriptional regulator, partial [Zhongshania sp.]